MTEQREGLQESLKKRRNKSKNLQTPLLQSMQGRLEAFFQSIEQLQTQGLRHLLTRLFFLPKTGLGLRVLHKKVRSTVCSEENLVQREMLLLQLLSFSQRIKDAGYVIRKEQETQMEQIYCML